jgi:signal transduction histidine kinase
VPELLDLGRAVLSLLEAGLEDEQHAPGMPACAPQQAPEMTVETLKTTQAQLIQSEKLSGIGEFVAGVAHELNNPLTSVMGFSELLVQADGNPQHKRHLEMIHKSAQRCQKIVQSLLSFARRHQPERKVVCLNRLVEAAVEILHYQLRTSNIEVTTQFDSELPPAMVDPHQLQQVFLNLLNNARQAIEAHQPKGWIKITTAARARKRHLPGQVGRAFHRRVCRRFLIRSYHQRNRQRPGSA